MRSRGILVIAAAVCAIGELEVLLGSGASRPELVSAAGVGALAGGLALSAWSPVSGAAAIAVVLGAQAAAGGVLAGGAVATIIALAVALFRAGRHARSGWPLLVAVATAAAAAMTRIIDDPAVRTVPDAILTCLAVSVPLLLGCWTRAQGRLQRALAATADHRAREREQEALHAAEAERARIAADLQLAVVQSLHVIGTATEDLQRTLAAGDDRVALRRLDDIAASARAALADVRRVLGVLRHRGEPAPLTPGLPRGDAAPAAAAGDGGRERMRAPAPGIELPVTAERLALGVVLAFAAIELALAATPVAGLLAVGVVAPLLWRRRRPVPSAVAVLAAISLESVLLDLDRFPVASMLAMVLATYAIGAHCGTRAAVAGAALIGAGACAHAAFFHPDGIVAAAAGGVVLPWTVGRLVRTNRRLTDAGRRHAREVERVVAAEAAAAVTRERLRLARELHDAVAHSLSVIAIQAGGAQVLVGRDRERARACADLIATVTAEAATELARLTGPEPVGDATDPAAPSLVHVERLADRARAAGLDVAVSMDPPPARLAGSLDLAAFRIVQEALANTAKHGHARRAWVDVRFAPNAVRLDVRDDGTGAGRGMAPAGRRGGGHGLIGMRERVALYGGSLDAGPAPGGGFRVRARLPLGVS